jgi:hypothetical protein
MGEGGVGCLEFSPVTLRIRLDSEPKQVPSKGEWLIEEVLS